jgi:DHA2 family multidrug resistance protein-like MFS transporter
MAGGALAAPLIGALGRARVVALGLAVSAAGFALYSRGGLTADYPLFLAGMIPGGLGMGMALTVTGDTVLSTVPKRRSGAASAISETATELGGALGIAILGSVLNAVYRGGLILPAGLPASAGTAARDSVGAALDAASALPAGLAAQVARAARAAFVDGMHVALYCSVGFAAVVAATALFTLRTVPKVIPEEGDDAAARADLISAAGE